MSYSNFLRAMDLAKKCQNFKTVGGKSDEDISKSETLLGVRFSRQCREYYSRYGYLSFFGSEIFGIFPDSKISVGNSVAFALRHREKFHLPVSWIPIFDYDDGYVAYFDYSSLNDEGEPEVILATYDPKQYGISDLRKNLSPLKDKERCSKLIKLMDKMYLEIEKIPM
ncbi:MAG: SMI1/KNR4 family protein, partial [Clostridia bacterium]|nr:SMI1/KNR4 family protein [Clostridia bacterium]